MPTRGACVGTCRHGGGSNCMATSALAAQHRMSCSIVPPVRHPVADVLLCETLTGWGGGWGARGCQAMPTARPTLVASTCAAQTCLNLLSRPSPEPYGCARHSTATTSAASTVPAPPPPPPLRGCWPGRCPLMAVDSRAWPGRRGARWPAAPPPALLGSAAAAVWDEVASLPRASVSEAAAAQSGLPCPLHVDRGGPTCTTVRACRAGDVFCVLVKSSWVCWQ